MDDDLWTRADKIFDEALDLPPEDRPEFLERACGKNEELRNLVVRLLAEADPERSSFVTGPSESFVAEAMEATLHDEPLEAGVVVGRYRVVREVGRGGMAVVYLAERADGEFRQSVALKVLKRGVDTDDVVRRFAQERQILAAASHPDIARLLDGGVTRDGRPFLVMEYVDGQPIDEYCDAQRLSVDERLRLFVRVGRAVAEAHRNLVVHRDIKPNNILVTPDGNVKLLDFGIAKVLDEGGTETDLTRTRNTFLTPAYATPEQVAGSPITTASDIYQLGLLLYELLTGTSPYPVPRSDSEALRRAVCESTPIRPSASTRPSPGAHELRRTTSRALQRKLTGDLDNILMTALRKEPERRYGTVDQLVSDIENHLSGRPVSARPDTFAYRTTKFVLRHRAASAFAALMAVLLVTFTATMAFQAQRIATERDRANLEADTAREVSEFLTNLFRVSDPGEARGNTVTAREILDRGAARIDEDLAGQPAVQARLKSTMGNVYQMLGLHEQAERLLREAVTGLESSVGGEDPDALEARAALAFCLVVRGDHEKASELYEAVIASRRRIFEPDDPETYALMAHAGDLYVKMGRFEEAEANLRESADALVRLRGEDHKDSLGALSNLAILLDRQGKHQESIETAARVLESRRRVLGDDHPDTLASLNNLAIYLAKQGRLEEAEPLFREAVEMSRRVRGNAHRGTAMTLSNLGTLLTIQERFDEADPLLREAMETYRHALGAAHPETLAATEAFGVLLTKTGRETEGEAVLVEVVNRTREVLGPEHHATASTLRHLGELYREQGRYEEARDRFQEGLSLLEPRFGPEHPEVLALREELDRVLTLTGAEDE